MAKQRAIRGDLPPYPSLRGRPGNYQARPFGYFLDDWPPEERAEHLQEHRQIKREYDTKYGAVSEDDYSEESYP